MKEIFIKIEGEIFLDNSITDKQFKDITHLCWDGPCARGCLDCQKIAVGPDILSLDNLEFVTDGVEIKNEKGNVLRQRISVCKNFVQGKKEPEVRKRKK